MKKKGLIFLALIMFVILSYFGWWQLPVSINRSSDIRFGNRIIANIESYRLKNGLPNSDDWELLKKLGFRDYGDFIIPDYEKISDTHYELVFIEGFDGPYLLWTSKDKIWKNDFPTIVEVTKNNH